MVTDQALRGLDSLELRPDQGQPERGRLARKAWAALWPKLLAIALVLVVWELIALSGWNPYVFKGPGPVFSDLWQQMQHGMLWSTIGWTMYSAVEGYGVALIIGSVVGLLVARIPPLRAAIGVGHHRPADDAVGRLGAVRDHPVRREQHRPSCSWSSWAPPRRLPTA